MDVSDIYCTIWSNIFHSINVRGTAETRGNFGIIFEVNF